MQEDKYYLLSLAHMDCFEDYYGDFDIIPKNYFPAVIYDGKDNDISYVKIPIIGKYIDGVMHDFVTGEIISKDICAGLYYIDTEEVSNFEVRNLFNSLDENDIRRYMKRLSELKEKSIQRYNVNIKIKSKQ